MNPDKVRQGFLLAIAVALATATLGTNPAVSRMFLRWTEHVTMGKVEVITPGDLQVWLRDPNRHKPLLLDVRTREEFEVSHLPKADFAPYPDVSITPFDVMDRATPIVLYCAAGIRSARAAERLMAAGYTNVRSLDGGIFQWVADGGRLEGPSATPPKVHPYNRVWRFFLDDQYRAPLP